MPPLSPYSAQTRCLHTSPPSHAGEPLSRMHEEWSPLPPGTHVVSPTAPPDTPRTSSLIRRRLANRLQRLISPDLTHLTSHRAERPRLLCNLSTNKRFKGSVCCTTRWLSMLGMAW